MRLDIVRPPSLERFLHQRFVLGFTQAAVGIVRIQKTLLPDQLVLQRDYRVNLTGKTKAGEAADSACAFTNACVLL
ncbi:hypothetical protein SODG_006381 [Sodalis praecaptivus]